MATATIAILIGLVSWTLFTNRITHLNRDLAVANGDLKEQKKIAVRRLEIANDQRAITDAVNRFLQDDLLRQAASESQIDWLVNEGMGPTTFMKDRTLVQILDRVAEKIANNQTPFENRPVVRAELMKTVGETYLSLGSLTKAQELLLQAAEIFKGREGSELRLIDTKLALARNRYQLGDHRNAISLLKSVGSDLQSVKLDLTDEKRLLKSLQADRELADVYVGIDNHLDQAIDLAKNSHEQFRALLGEDDPETMKAEITLGKALLDLGQFEAGIARLKSSIASASRKYGEKHPATMGARFELANGYYRSLKFSDAFQSFDSVWKDAVEILGEEHPTTVYYQVHSAFALWEDTGRSISEQDRRSKAQHHRSRRPRPAPGCPS